MSTVSKPCDRGANVRHSESAPPNRGLNLPIAALRLLPTRQDAASTQSHHQFPPLAGALLAPRACDSVWPFAGLMFSLAAIASGSISTPPLTENIQNRSLTNLTLANAGVFFGTS